MYLYSHTCQSLGRGYHRVVMEVVNPRHFQSTLDVYAVHMRKWVLEACEQPLGKDVVQAVWH